MFKRLFGGGQLNSQKKIWGPLSVREYLDRLKEFSGTEWGIVEQTEISLNFAIPSGGSETQSLPSKDGYWILTAKKSSISPTEGRQFGAPGLINISSYAGSQDPDTGEYINVILIEDQPIVNVFGSGEWQEYQYIDYPPNVNNRIFQIRNLSTEDAYVTISLKAIRILPESLEK